MAGFHQSPVIWRSDAASPLRTTTCPGGPVPVRAGGHAIERPDMRIVIERGDLLRALGHVASVVERRTTLPILSNALLQASEGGSLALKGTIPKRQAVETVGGADVTQPGAITVLGAPAARHRPSKLPDGAQVDA